MSSDEPKNIFRNPDNDKDVSPEGQISPEDLARQMEDDHPGAREAELMQELEEV